MRNFADLLNIFEVLLLFVPSDATEIEVRNWRVSDVNEKLNDVRLSGFEIETHKAKNRSVRSKGQICKPVIHNPTKMRQT